MRSDSDRQKGTQVQTPTWLGVTRLLLAIAAVVDVYLLWASSSGGVMAGCGPESNCHTVLQSQWAYWFGVPVSAPALIVYAVLFTGTFWLEPPWSARQRPAWLLLVACSVIVLGASLWFVGLQLFALKTICPYCMTAHTCALMAAALLLSQAALVRRSSGKGQTPKSQPFRRGDLLLPTATAALAVAILVTGQVLYRPKTYLSNPVVAGVVTNAPTVVSRQFQLFDGQFQFQLNEVPLIGKLDAAHVMVSLFDYTCHHCRQVHPILMDAQRQFSNQLAIISLPMPLDSHCNPRILRTQPPHTNACALARIGLAVWSADHQKAGVFDDWVFAPERPPLPAVAETYARQLVGTEAFDKASTNSWVDEQLRRDIAIYETNYRLFHKSAMPEAIIGTNLISGVFSRAQLLTMLTEQFGL